MARPAPTAVAAALAVVVLLGVAVAPVAAHVNHVEADDQRSADGTLLVEWEFVGTDGWVVVRADDGGDPGEVLGHRRVTPETAFRTDTTVAIDDGKWADIEGSREVWVVLHREEGGEGFDVEEDPMQTGFSGDPAGTRLTVEKADGATSVAAQGFDAETVTDGTATVRRVELAADGHLAVHAVDGDIAGNVEDGDVGEPVGSVALSAGVHENVTVELDESFLADADSEELLAAVAYAGGDGFGADSTAPVTAGDSLVSTTFGAEFRGPATGPTPTPTAEESSIVNTPEPTATPATTPTGTDGSGAGVGAVGAALALAGALLAARRYG
ncbi:DUF7282 domain-containing protein [Natronomonas marina]|jgi:hypothetical protein|uniref:DUF7282 domain-containing protein n=1 Tax=Natronomonas marina TaxID=2961939 RepID=UPI0020CA0A60|nr:hypothetical protein [Natronomonas marina]